MTPPGLLFAAAALLPAMTGVPGEAGAERIRSLALALCGGGSLVLPIEGNDRPTPATTPCCAKGCHASGRPRRSDRSR